MVLRREVRRQQTNGRQVHRALREQVQHDRELPRGPRSLDPVAGGSFGEPKHLRAVSEETSRPFAAVEFAPVELGQMGDELYGHLA